MSNSLRRRVAIIFTSPTQKEGAGFEVQRPFPGRFISDQLTDPFLLLDEFGPKDLPAGGPGAPWHPHRGFDTVTYLRHGQSAHQDSMGNSGVIRSGEVQWMRAGSGILHDEGRDHPGGLSHGFQMWVNLPKALKMSPPSYQQLSQETFLWHDWSQGARLKIIAGELAAKSGPPLSSPLVLTVPLLIVDVEITGPAGTTVDLPISGLLDTCMVYVYKGEGRVLSGTTDKSGAAIHRKDLVMFTSPNDTADVESNDSQTLPPPVQGGALSSMTSITFSSVSNDGLGLLVLAGKKIGDPIARYGPFVMNTQEELQAAFEDYKSGKLALTKASVNTL